MTPLHALLQWVRHPLFIAGVRDMLPASPGIGAWGITTGGGASQLRDEFARGQRYDLEWCLLAARNWQPCR